MASITYSVSQYSLKLVFSFVSYVSESQGKIFETRSFCCYLFLKTISVHHPRKFLSIVHCRQQIENNNDIKKNHKIIEYATNSNETKGNPVKKMVDNNNHN